MRIVVVIGGKGGVGKTTVVMNLAACEAESGSRVLVTDADHQESATFWADQAGERLPFDLTSGTDPGSLAQLRKLPYDVVFVDTPGSLVASPDALRAVLAEADMAILPTVPEPLALPPLANTIRKFLLPTGVDYRALLSRCDRSKGPARISDAAAFLDERGIARFRAYIGAYSIHSDAPGTGDVVTTYPTTSTTPPKAIEDFRKVHAEMTSAWARAASADDTTAMLQEAR